MPPPGRSTRRHRAPPRPAASNPARINVTPMIDVGMVLIVFFLLVGHLAGERRGRVDLPVATEGAEENAALRPVVVLVVDETTVRVDGTDTPTDQLAQAIAERVAANAQADRDGGVHVRADATVSFDTVRPILSACKDAGITQVQLAVKPEWADR